METWTRLVPGFEKTRVVLTISRAAMCPSSALSLRALAVRRRRGDQQSPRRQEPVGTLLLLPGPAVRQCRPDLSRDRFLRDISL